MGVCGIEDSNNNLVKSVIKEIKLLKKKEGEFKCPKCYSTTDIKYTKKIPIKVQNSYYTDNGEDELIAVPCGCGSSDWVQNPDYQSTYHKAEYKYKNEEIIIKRWNFDFEKNEFGFEEKYDKLKNWNKISFYCCNCKEQCSIITFIHNKIFEYKEKNIV